MDPGEFSEQDENKFWSKVEKTANEKGCLVWGGTRDRAGYGRFKHRGRYLSAHRLSRLFTHGKITDGLCVLHSCDNPACVNPGHLFLGTHLDNMVDAMAKGRHVDIRKYPVKDHQRARGEAHGMSKLTAGIVRLVRSEYQFRKITLHKLSAKYGISVAALHCAIRGKTWAHVTP